jgi:transposase
MTLYCGIDLHANNSVIAVLDETDRVVMERRVANELSQILAVLHPYRADLTGCVVESTYNWYWLVDGLMEAGFVVHLAHTGAVPQYAGIKYTDDESDARHLAHLLRLGILPQGYILPKEQRALRDLLRRRLLLVRQCNAGPDPNLLVIKPALRAAMRVERIANVALKRRLGISEAADSRLVDPDHAFRRNGVVAALSDLGRGLIIEDQKQVAA